MTILIEKEKLIHDLILILHDDVCAPYGHLDPYYVFKTIKDQPDLQSTCNQLATDCISRQAAIQTALDFIVEYLGGAFDEDFQKMLTERINALPSAQPDGIPLEWIDKHLEWLDNCDNDFAQLAKVGIRAMVEIWKKDKT